ncbi:hypothetical protein [Parabacteroides sp.]
MLKQLSTCILAVLLLSVVGCQDELPDKQEGTEGKGTVTLTFTAERGQTVQTKSEIRPSASGSEADKAGFSYEMVVTSIDSVSPETKAKPASFKNAIALLFTSGGLFNGRAEIGEFKGGIPLTATFTGVNTPNATNCRLVLVAHDNDSSQDLITSALSTYSGNYSMFCTNGATTPVVDASTITKDADIPYVGSVTGVNLSDKSTTVNNIPLFRMLSKTTVTAQLLNTPDTTKCQIFLEMIRYKDCPFGTVNEYDGSGTKTVEPLTTGSNALNTTQKTHTFYAGEVVKPNLTATTLLERNQDNVGKTARVNIVLYCKVKDPATAKVDIGEEFTNLSTLFFHVYLGSNGVSDFSLRRNHNYDITVTLNGTLEDFTTRSRTDKRIRTYGEAGGLCIGYFGGGEYTSASLANVAGAYTKKLLVEPNTSRSISKADSVQVQWNKTPLSAITQTTGQKYWDYGYIKSLLNNGGMDDNAGSAYKYCYDLTLGGVPPGTWYVPTQVQFFAIYTTLSKMKDNPRYQYYTKLRGNNAYWSSTESTSATACYFNIAPNTFTAYTATKGTPFYIRCVRDTD